MVLFGILFIIIMNHYAWHNFIYITTRVGLPKQEQDCLHALASTGALPIGVNQLAMSDQYLKNHFEKLARNGLLEKRAQNQYAFQVELVRRWFLNPV